MNMSVGVFILASATAVIGLLGKIFSRYVTHVPEEEYWTDPIWRWDRLAMSVRWFRPACAVALAAAFAAAILSALS